ncbi:MAG: RNA methyltransferase [Bacteroidia bacterium]|nr:RNA methyltransferase [Bacteroidia bacterium]
MGIITSIKNSKIKSILDLQESKERRRQNNFIIEGSREINLASLAGYSFQKIIKAPEIADEKKFSVLLKNITVKPEIIEISRNIFEKIAYRENKDGLIAVAESKHLCLSDLALKKNPLIIVLESVEKPGNLGAILRTADAANVDAVIVCDLRTDLYNPNTIRSSIGCVFTNQVVACTSDEVIKWFRKNKIKIYSTALTEKARDLYMADFTVPSAIVMGSEAFGLSDVWLKNSDDIIIIPMYGRIDSLNVSASCAVVVFEAVRQRKYTKKIKAEK